MAEASSFGLARIARAPQPRHPSRSIQLRPRARIVSKTSDMTRRCGHSASQCSRLRRTCVPPKLGKQRIACSKRHIAARKTRPRKVRASDANTTKAAKRGGREGGREGGSLAIRRLAFSNVGAPFQSQACLFNRRHASARTGRSPAACGSLPASRTASLT